MNGPVLEFVNREHAEAEAARAIELLNQSDDAKVEAWFALQAVADEVGPTSNVGVKGISWVDRPNRPQGNYRIYLRCVDGLLSQSMIGPRTLEEARHQQALAPAVAVMERKAAELGGPLLTGGRRPKGTSAALIAAVQASSAGMAWVAARRRAAFLLRSMVVVADAYGRDGVNPAASLSAHVELIAFDDRVELIREFPSTVNARAKALSLNPARYNESSTEVNRRQIKRLSTMAGVSPALARSILRAMLNGRSKRQIVRAVNLAAEIVEEDPRNRTLEAVA